METFQEIETAFRYEKERLEIWSRRGGQTSVRYTLFLIVLAVLAVNFMVSIPSSPQKGGPIIMSLICLGLCAFILWVKKQGKAGMVIASELYHDGAEYRVVIKQDGIDYQVEGESGTIPYTSELKVWEYGSVFDIRYGKGRAFFLPKEAMPEEQSVSLSHFFEDTLGKNFKFCG